LADTDAFALKPIGVVRSSLQRREDAPRQGYEGAPDAWIEIDPAFAVAAADIRTGDTLILLTWFHQGRRDVQQVHPRSIPGRPLTGVFSTRSPDRPNPIGLHRVEVLAVEEARIQVSPLEAIDGTPVVDIKPLLPEVTDF
jgi:tRNA-Thr(GGU) m(6)t(6)A37 methyltransferase TsaA